MTTEGRARVSANPPTPDDDDALPLLQQIHSSAVLELAPGIPEFSAPSALWGARLFYRLCRVLVCRDLGEAEVSAIDADPCPEPRRPRTDWSVDLMLRHLPRIWQFARHLSNGDPLVEKLKNIAAAWPLSSVGIQGVENLNIETFAGNAALRRLYADRIIAAGDASRLGHAEVDQLLRTDLGLHRELAPQLAAKLFSATHDTH